MTDKIQELKLIPSNDIRVNTMIAPFNDDMLKEHDFKDRAEFSKAMFKTVAESRPPLSKTMHCFLIFSLMRI